MLSKIIVNKNRMLFIVIKRSKRQIYRKKSIEINTVLIIDWILLDESFGNSIKDKISSNVGSFRA